MLALLFLLSARLLLPPAPPLQWLLPLLSMKVTLVSGVEGLVELVKTKT